MSGTQVELTVADADSLRIDVFLARAVPDTSRSCIQRGIRQDGVLLNGRVVSRPSIRVQCGDRIAWTPPRPKPATVIPEAVPLDIAYEDAHLLVVNKPAGMPTHPGPGHSTGTLVHALVHHVGGPVVAADRRQSDKEIGLSNVHDGPHIRPGIVHRLDKDTSGLLVVAKDDATHRGLAAQFEQRTTGRTYQGIVAGVPDPPRGRIETTIGRSPRDRKKMAVVDAARGRHAATQYAVVRPFMFAALVTFRLETGRTHQIRVHAQHKGHPILGDPTYGGRTIAYGPVTRRRRATYRRVFEQLTRQALHATSLRFVHPRSGRTVSVSSALPADMQAVLELLACAEP